MRNARSFNPAQEQNVREHLCCFNQPFVYRTVTSGYPHPHSSIRLRLQAQTERKLNKNKYISYLISARLGSWNTQWPSRGSGWQRATCVFHSMVGGKEKGNFKKISFLKSGHHFSMLGKRGAKNSRSASDSKRSNQLATPLSKQYSVFILAIGIQQLVKEFIIYGREFNYRRQKFRFWLCNISIFGDMDLVQQQQFRFSWHIFDVVIVDSKPLSYLFLAVKCHSRLQCANFFLSLW